jgi:type VI protein secretion system component VasF
MTALIQNPMDANDSSQANEVVIRVPFWLVVLVSAVLLMAGYAVYYFLTGGNSN